MTPAKPEVTAAELAREEKVKQEVQKDHEMLRLIDAITNLSD